MRTEGVYANGSVTVRPLPEEVHGGSAERTVPLRRLEGGQIRQQDLDDHLAKERVKVGLSPPGLNGFHHFLIEYMSQQLCPQGDAHARVVRLSRVRQNLAWCICCRPDLSARFEHHRWFACA